MFQINGDLDLYVKIEGWNVLNVAKCCRQHSRVDFPKISLNFLCFKVSCQSEGRTCMIQQYENSRLLESDIEFSIEIRWKLRDTIKERKDEKFRLKKALGKQ